MFQSSAKYVVKNHKVVTNVEESKLELDIAKFATMTREIESPKLKLFSVGAAWWVSVMKAQNTIKVTFKVEGSLEDSSGSFKFLTKGEIQNQLFIGPLSIPLVKEGVWEYISNVAINQQQLSSGGSLFLILTLSVEHECDKSQEGKFFDPVDMKREIISNVSKMQNDSRFSDFTFIVKKKEFKIHKIILAATSEVFANLFTTEMEESGSNKCTVNHLDSTAFGQMLDFVYSGNLPAEFNADIAQCLFEVAHYYDIKLLTKLCEQEFMCGLNSGNALELYKLSHVYDLKELKNTSWEIVKREILKIFFPLKNEPLSLSVINELLERQKKDKTFWKKFK